jgi:hypothetical protein
MKPGWDVRWAAPWLKADIEKSAILSWAFTLKQGDLGMSHACSTGYKVIAVLDRIRKQGPHPVLRRSLTDRDLRARRTSPNRKRLSRSNVEDLLGKTREPPCHRASVLARYKKVLWPKRL